MTLPTNTERNLRLLSEIQSKGKFALPAENGVDIVPCDIPDSIIYSTDLAILDNLQAFGEYLKLQQPSFSLKGGCPVAKFLELGFEPNDDVYVYAFMAPKLVNSKSHLVEKLRADFVSEVFERKLSESNADKSFDGDPLDSAENFIGSLGISLIVVGPDGVPHCIAASDIKYPSNQPFVYEKGGEKSVSGNYIRKFIEQAKAFKDNNGESLIVNDFEGAPDFIIEEMEDGRFKLVIPPSIVKSGYLPLDTLLKDTEVHRADVEIGQFAGNGIFFGASIFLACHFIHLFKEAVSVQENIRAGFTLSPLLLKQINGLQGEGLDRILGFMGCMEYGSLVGRNEIVKLINCFSRGMNLYPLDSTKVSEIRLKDGSKVFIRGGYQADSWEDPAYYDFTSLTHLFA